MYVSSRAGRSLRCGAPPSRFRAQWSGGYPLWPVRNGGKKSVMASSSITTRMRRTGPLALGIRYERSPTPVSPRHFSGTKFLTVTQLTLRCSRYRSASRKSVIRKPAWMQSLARLTNYWNSRTTTKPTVSATHRGRRTFARPKPKRHGWRRRALSQGRRSRESRCRSSWLQTLLIKQQRWLAWKDGRANMPR